MDAANPPGVGCGGRLTSGTLVLVQQLRLIRVMAAAWFAALFVFTVVMLAIADSWAPESDTAVLELPPAVDAGPVGLIATVVIGLAGLVAAMIWRNRVTEAPVVGPKLLSSFLVTVAIAEAGVLVGIVFAVVGQTLIPFWLGAGIFVTALAVMVTAIPLVEIDEG